MQREVDTNSDLARRIRYPVNHYLQRLYYDTVCFEREYLRYAANVVGPDGLVLGSDNPFPLGAPDPVGFVRAAFEGNDWAERILHENAVNLLKISVEGSE